MTATRIAGACLALAAAAVWACSSSTEPSTQGQSRTIDSTVASAPKYPEAPSYDMADTTVLDTAKTTAISGDSATTTTWVDQSIHVSISQNPNDYFMYDPLTSVLWSGNLVQGTSSSGSTTTTAARASGTGAWRATTSRSTRRPTPGRDRTGSC